jgi:hypothetical protein
MKTIVSYIELNCCCWKLMSITSERCVGKCIYRSDNSNCSMMKVVNIRKYIYIICVLCVKLIRKILHVLCI